ncbi:hypothetical protein Tsubulata_023090 [Turnera subulata]|uniref:TF-B3 domain-containing protein n=1 Tax=Turnera subulata TaxID=218843 RepID=A0A9Q0FU72_9ROSI|nr:hypothetical protein Tsubulata_023090 [Turnera subulata]
MRPSETDSKTGRPFSLFFKVVFPMEFKEKKMRIPPKFVRYYRNELSHAATIVVPTGRVWPIGLSEKRKEIFFDKGLPRFLEHYSITEGQFLIFNYEGNSRFNVHICDTSCCEIRYPPDEINNNEGPSRQRGEPSHRSTPVDTVNLPKPSDFSSPLRRQCNLNNNGTRTSTKGKGKVRTDVGEMEFTELEEEETWETEFMELEEEETGCGEQCANTFANNRVGSQSVEMVDLDSSDGSETHEASNTTRRGLNEAKGKRKECYGTKENKLFSASPASQKAIQEAEKIEAHNPCFLHLLSNHDMTKYQMSVPGKFAYRYLSEAGHRDRILIQGSHGGEWRLGYTHKRGEYPSYFMNLGFGQFVADNMLREGDVLHFELVDRENPTLKVNIFHANEFSG